MIELKITIDPANDKAHVINNVKGSFPELCVEFCTLYMNFIRIINKNTSLPIEFIYASIEAAMDACIVDIMKNKEVLN